VEVAALEPYHPLLDPVVLTALQEVVSAHLGRAWRCEVFSELDDLASHPCGVLRGQDVGVFAKLSTESAGPAMFGAELQGMALLHRVAGVPTPAAVGTGVVQVPSGVVILVEGLQGRHRGDRSPEDWRSIGATLAALHAVQGERFGLEAFDGFFGPLPQDNRSTSTGTWAEFYAERRLRPRLRDAADAGHLTADLASQIEALLGRLVSLCGPEPAPSLLHGDAQQNNFVSTDAGAVIVDSAPYFGHPEVDLALVARLAAALDTYR